MNDDIFAPFDEAEWREWSWQGIMPPSDDKPLPTPKMPRLKRGKVIALINGIPAEEYIRQHPEPPH